MLNKYKFKSYLFNLSIQEQEAMDTLYRSGRTNGSQPIDLLCKRKQTLPREMMKKRKYVSL